MFFRVLSHAGLEVSEGSETLLFDPWLIGSTYWRSWWNYPPCTEELIQQLSPTAIYLTHVHWDHYAAPSLRLFDKGTRFIIPREPAGRMARDLSVLGFHNVEELDHGSSTKIGSIKLTSYQFSVFTDSAAVVEVGDVVLLNANDAKLMGRPLKQITQNHPSIDFVFRSHSSANSRVMYEITDGDIDTFEDRERYIEDFYYFVNATSARYAIPFASNHCHLHKDVFDMNNYVVTPKEVEDYWHRKNISEPQLKVMVSGDSWSSENGFVISEVDYFSDRDERLVAYQESVSDKLNATYTRESKAKVSEARVEKYFAQAFNAMPWILRRLFKDHKLLYVLTADDKNVACIEVDCYAKQVKFIEQFSDESHPMQIRTAAALFNHCIASHLFSHLSISKRVKFRTTRANLKKLRVWGFFLNCYEYDLLPVRKIFSRRFVHQWARRWREMLLYVGIVWALVSGKKFKYRNFLPAGRKIGA